MSLNTMPVEMFNKIASYLTEDDAWSLINACRRAVFKEYCRHMFVKNDKTIQNLWCVESGLFELIVTGTLDYTISTHYLCEVCGDFDCDCFYVHHDICYECHGNGYCYCVDPLSPPSAKKIKRYNPCKEKKLVEHVYSETIDKTTKKTVKFFFFNKDTMKDIDFDETQCDRLGKWILLKNYDSALFYLNHYYRTTVSYYKCT
ncbi:orf21 [Artaxa digramma nucleopolyhedrovirus]|uniref:Orf21 n=1 Tax=Artaxa digramma nucleopolyhedrovirus TaxID=3070910 RepID=A0AAE6R6H0_9ABAC|nr:orf21 [Euproctis digramma nucleopolyhedrovirus]QHB21680.1 orf21 [Artaxa digramma nucleopolyhedrovirus]